MAITYEEAVARLEEWTDNPALRNHARGVEAAPLADGATALVRHPAVRPAA